jgi:integrase
VIGSNVTLEEFLVEWWDTYAATHLRPNTLATYTTLLDKWIVPYLGRKRLREITRETIDNYAARLRVDGAGGPTINRTLGLLQGVFHRAVEWRRLAWNPVVGVRRVAHPRAETIDARTPEIVEAIRAQLDTQNAALVSVLAYGGLRPAEAYALVWSDVLDDRGRPRERLRVQRPSPAAKSPRRNRSAAANQSCSNRSRASSSSSTSLAVAPTFRRWSSPTAKAVTSVGITGAVASGSPRSSVPVSPTSAAMTFATHAPRCCSTRAAR